MTDKKQIIVMMGGAGVGKGTFSKMLMAQRPFSYIETGALLRSAPSGSEIAQTLATGTLVSDALVCDLIQSKITPTQNIILDGFPRNLYQAQWLIKNYSDTYDIHVLFLDVPRDVMIARINKRLNEGSTRNDDASSATINHRLETFDNITMPAIKWLQTAPNIAFSRIDATGTATDNFQDILNALNM